MATTKKYEEINAELEQIIVSLQSGDNGLDESVKKYQRGTELVAELEKYLKEIKNKVSQISAKLSDK